MPRALLAFLLLAPVAALAGCAGCTELPATAHMGFVYEGSEAELRAEFEALGWRVLRAQNALQFGILQEWNGTRYQGTVHYSGIARAGDVAVVDVRGALKGSGPTEEARAHLAPVVEPVATRFGAEAEYGAGATHCGDV